MSVLNDYKGSWLRGDVIAGITVAAIAIPESLGYAKIAGLPIQTGLYCALLPALMFALIGSSRQLVVGADSATAALVAAGAGLVAAQGDRRVRLRCRGAAASSPRCSCCCSRWRSWSSSRT